MLIKAPKVTCIIVVYSCYVAKPLLLAVDAALMGFDIIIIFLFSQIHTLLACGGLSKNPIYIQEHADIIGMY